jgi:PDDEXK-like domain of unknown function (DUF3799)
MAGEDNGDAAAAALAEKLAERPAAPPPRRVTEAGFYPDLTPRDYHQDPAPAPSLSAGVGITLITKTPFHAFMQQPRLTARFREEAELEEVEGYEARRALGNVAHELLLGRGQGIHIISETKDSKGTVIPNPTGYTHKETQRIRDAVLAQGATPCLVHELRAAENIVDAVKFHLEQTPGCDGFFTKGQAEVTAIWEEKHLGIWCRMLMDWWGPTEEIVLDLKTTRAGLGDELLARKIANENLDFRAAWYERGLCRLYPELAGRTRYILVFIEQQPPHWVRVVRLGQHSLARGHKKVAHALGTYARCLHAEHWPGYPHEITRLDAKIFGSADEWTQREETDEQVREDILADPFVTALDVDDERADTQLGEFVP